MTGEGEHSPGSAVSIRRSVYFTMKTLKLTAVASVMAVLLSTSDAARPPYLSLFEELIAGLLLTMFLFLMYNWNRNWRRSVDADTERRGTNR